MNEMREFFKGWRRKVGCVALVMACVLFAGWMRSLVFHFGIGFPNDTSLISSQGSLKWNRYSEFDAEHSPQPLHWFSMRHTYPKGTPQWTKPIPLWTKPIWRYDTGAIAIDSYHVVDFDDKTILHSVDSWIVQYWAITTPLTLLSAYLILWKPRPKERRDA
jgi:hypothetical protein